MDEYMLPVLVHGHIVWHTREEYAALWKGVDREAAAAMTASIDDYVDEETRRRDPAWQCMNCGSIRCDGEHCSVRDEDEDS